MSTEHTDEDIDANETGTPVTQTKSDPSANDQDVKNVVSQRDRANEETRKLREELAEKDERLARLEMSDIERDKRESIGSFIKDNKDKYPDVEPEDLLSATDPADLEDLAKKRQEKYSAIEQRALAKLQVTDEDVEPTLEEIKAQEKKLLDDPKVEDKFTAVMDQRLGSFNKK